MRLRVSVNDTSSSGNVYSGYRFLGEVTEWPPLSDLSGHDVYVQITASGPLRRINRAGGRGSALTRYYGTLEDPFTPVAYWPCEEDPDASILGAGVEGGTDMAVTSGTPKFKALDKFNGSHPVAVVNKSTWDGLTGAFGSGGNDVYTVCTSGWPQRRRSMCGAGALVAVARTARRAQPVVVVSSGRTPRSR